MVTRTEILLIDDLDGGPAERTVRFALDGADYETELAPGNIATLEDTLARYIAAARAVGRPARGKRKGARTAPGRIVPAAPPNGLTPPDRPDLAGRREQIRRWAQAERPDLGVGDRGRISSAAIAAYNAAHGLGS